MTRADEQWDPMKKTWKSLEFTCAQMKGQRERLPRRILANFINFFYPALHLMAASVADDVARRLLLIRQTENDAHLCENLSSMPIFHVCRICKLRYSATTRQESLHHSGETRLRMRACKCTVGSYCAVCQCSFWLVKLSLQTMN